jgi:hypothetical protein
LRHAVHDYLTRFVDLLAVPFDNIGAVWAILPIYTSLILGEMYKSKVSFGHAVANGFVMVWAGLNWARHLANASIASYLFSSKSLAWIVTAACIGLGVFTIVLGLRKKDKALCEILGHTRFSCYFIIMLYPMQAGLVKWSWPSLATVLIFALPCWFLIYLIGRLAARLLK